MDKINSLVSNSFQKVGINVNGDYYYNQSVNSISEDVIKRTETLCNEILHKIDMASKQGQFHISIFVDIRCYPESVIIAVKRYLREHNFLLVSFDNDYNSYHIRWTISWVYLGGYKND